MKLIQVRWDREMDDIYNSLGFIEVQCIQLINVEHILEPQCKYISSLQKPSDYSRSFQQPWLLDDDDPINLLSLDNLKCRVMQSCLYQ